MAEDDDDEGFGDFTFASFNPSVNFNPQTHQSSALKSPITSSTTSGKLEEEDDDEWGDFVETPLGSFTSSNNTPSNSSSAVDPFNAFFQNQIPAANLEKSDSGKSFVSKSEPASEQKKGNRDQNGWVKLKGAIPLSIFGDIEEEENEEDSAGSAMSGPHHMNGKDLNVDKKVDNVSDPSKINGNLGVSFNLDTITSLYNQQSYVTKNNGVDVPMNGLGLDTNGADIRQRDSDLESSGVDFFGVSMHKRGNSDSVMDFSSQTLQRKDVVNGSSNGTTSNLNALDLDFSGWNVDFNANSNPNAIKNVNDHSQQGEIIGSSNGIGFDMKDTNFPLFDGLNLKSDVKESNIIPLSLNTNGVGIVLNFNGQEEEFHGSEFHDGSVAGAGTGTGDGDDGDDDDEWEFKDAHVPSQVNEWNQQVRYEVEVGKTAENNAMSKLGNGTVGSTDLFIASNGSKDLFSMSNGFSSKTDWSNFGLGIRSNNTVDNQFASDAYLSGDQTGSSAVIQNPHSVSENVDSDEDFGDFAAAYGETVELSGADSKVHETYNVNASSLGFDGSNGQVDFSALNGSAYVFPPSNGEIGGVSAVLDIKSIATDNAEAAQSDYTYDTSLRIEQMEGKSLGDPDFIHQIAESDENFGDFREAFAESALRNGELKIGSQQSELKGLERDNQDKQIRLDQYQGALPLSIFGDEENQVDGSSNFSDAFVLQPAPSKGNDCSPNLPTSINDIISNLYSQAEHVASPSSLHNLVENGLVPSDTVSSVSDLVNYADASDDNSWEFKDSFSHGVAEIGRLSSENENTDERNSSKLKLESYVDFYSKLQDELYFIVKVHFASLKDTQSGENWAALAEEIQGKELGRENAITKEDNLGNLNNFVKRLQEPKFHVLQMEYDLESKFMEVERDVRSVVELIQHAKTMLKILMLGSSEDQSSYVSVWSKMISACAQQMQHGAVIWRQAMEKDIHSQILAEPKGITFVLALGEIYRAAVLLEASVKLYKPWILSSHIELSKLYSLLEECHSSWSSSGLQDALSSVLDAALSEGYPSLPSLLDSVEYIYDLDELALQNHVFIPQEPLCRLSLLTPDVAPGMAMVSWNGEHCFLRLANLWVNLISTDHPKLPPLCVNG